jgi:hypothetical protein
MLKKDVVMQANATAKTSSGPLPEWMVFPHLAEVFEPTPERAIALLAQKFETYQKQANDGPPAERVRARMIAAGYARTGALLRELEGARLAFLVRNTDAPSNAQQDQIKTKEKVHGRL